MVMAHERNLRHEPLKQIAAEDAHVTAEMKEALKLKENGERRRGQHWLLCRR